MPLLHLFLYAIRLKRRIQFIPDSLKLIGL